MNERATDADPPGFERAPVGLAVTDRRGRFLSVNPMLCVIAGRSRTEMLTLGVADITHPDDLVADARARERFAAGEIERCTHEKRYVLPDGDVRRIALHVRRIGDGEGADGVPMFAASMVPIESREVGSDAERAFAATDAIVVSWDADLRTRRVNPAALEALGFASLDEALARPAPDWFVPLDLERLRPEAYRRGHRLLRRAAQGPPVEVMCEVSALHDERGRPDGRVMVALDVAPAPSDDDGAATTAPSTAARVRTVIERLTATVDDLVDVALARDGGLPLEREPAELGELLERLVRERRPSVEARGRSLTHVPASGPLTVDVDPRRLSRAVAPRGREPGGRRLPVLRRRRHGEPEPAARGTGGARRGRRRRRRSRTGTTRADLRAVRARRVARQCRRRARTRGRARCRPRSRRVARRHRRRVGLRDALSAAAAAARIAGGGRRAGDVPVALPGGRSSAPARRRSGRTASARRPREDGREDACGRTHRRMRPGDRLQYMCCPPLTDIVDPVMKSASSATRKATARAMSSALPSRPTGILAMIFWSTSSGTARTMSVST